MGRSLAKPIIGSVDGSMMGIASLNPPYELDPPRKLAAATEIPGGSNAISPEIVHQGKIASHPLRREAVISVRAAVGKSSTRASRRVGATTETTAVISRSA
jgi:hypothetical protein